MWIFLEVLKCFIFYWEAMAIPTGEIMDTIPNGNMETVDDILQDFIESMSHV